MVGKILTLISESCLPPTRAWAHKEWREWKQKRSGGLQTKRQDEIEATKL